MSWPSGLLSAVPDQPYNFRIYVHPSKTVNALALPGGTIILFQGLINITDTPEELAGVMAHEFQHVLKRHSTRGIIRSEAINIFATVVSGDSVMNVILQAGGLMEVLAVQPKAGVTSGFGRDEDGVGLPKLTRRE